jgi:hypothetical protein
VTGKAGSSSSAYPAWVSVVTDLGAALLIKYPLLISTWAWRQVFDRTALALFVVVPLSLTFAGTVIGWWGVSRGAWGEPVATAWKNERTAANNIEILRAEIEERNLHPPAATFGPGGAEITRRDQAAWRQGIADLRAEIEGQELYRPFWFWPRAPHKLSKWPHWQLFYDVHHFFFGTVYAPAALIYLVLGLAPGWKGSNRRWRRRERKGFAGRTAEKHYLGLGEKDARPRYLTREERNHHLLVSGATGSGKTEGLLQLAEHDIEAGLPVVVIDMKGDRQFASDLHAACVAAGRKDDFLYLTLEPGLSHSYNPLASGDVLARRDRLMSACIWSDEAFYRNEAKAALSRVLTALSGRGEITLDDLYLAFDEKDAYAAVREAASPRDQPKFDRDLENWTTFWRDMSGLRANLHEFLPLRDRLCVAHADIDFREVHRRDRVVYLGLNSQMKKEAAAALAKMALEDLKHLSGSLAAGSETDRKPFSVYIDEARHAVYDGFVGFISQCRSAGIGLTLATQSPLDFDVCEAGVTLAVIQNTVTKLFFCQPDAASAKFCAELGGTADAVKQTKQVVDEGFGPVATGVYSERGTKEFQVHPDELKTLTVGRALLIQGPAPRTIIRTHYEPRARSIPFAPTFPRKWLPGDRALLGHDRPPLGLAGRLGAGEDDRESAPKAASGEKKKGR